MESFWGHLGVILGSSWDHFGVTLKSFWDDLGISLGSVWGHFGIVPSRPNGTVARTGRSPERPDSRQNGPRQNGARTETRLEVPPERPERQNGQNARTITASQHGHGPWPWPRVMAAAMAMARAVAPGHGQGPGMRGEFSGSVPCRIPSSHVCKNRHD